MPLPWAGRRAQSLPGPIIHPASSWQLRIRPWSLSASGPAAVPEGSGTCSPPTPHGSSATTPHGCLGLFLWEPQKAPAGGKLGPGGWGAATGAPHCSLWPLPELLLLGPGEEVGCGLTLLPLREPVERLPGEGGGGGEARAAVHRRRGPEGQPAHVCGGRHRHVLHRAGRHLLPLGDG